MYVLEKGKEYLRMEPLGFLCCLIRGAAPGTQSDDDDV